MAILPLIVAPLRGPEPLTEEDTMGMPPTLYLEDTKLAYDFDFEDMMLAQEKITRHANCYY